MQHPSKTQGLSLVELMVAVSILAILGALAAPAYTNMVERMQVANTTDQLVASLNLTRSEAISRNGRVTIARIDETNCSNNKSQNWSCGWEVFHDLDNDGKLDANETLIHRTALSKGASVIQQGSSTELKTNRWGQLSGLNAVSFTVKGINSKAENAICVNSGGRVRVIESSSICK